MSRHFLVLLFASAIVLPVAMAADRTNIVVIMAYFGHLSGACNFFKGDNSFRVNGQPWKVPDSGFYTTVANVDFAPDFLKEARAEQQPFFLYVD